MFLQGVYLGIKAALGPRFPVVKREPAQPADVRHQMTSREGHISLYIVFGELVDAPMFSSCRKSTRSVLLSMFPLVLAHRIFYMTQVFLRCLWSSGDSQPLLFCLHDKLW